MEHCQSLMCSKDSYIYFRAVFRIKSSYNVYYVKYTTQSSSSLLNDSIIFVIFFKISQFCLKDMELRVKITDFLSKYGEVVQDCLIMIQETVK